MFGIRTTLRQRFHATIREIASNTPLVFGGDGDRLEGWDRIVVAPTANVADAILNVNGGTISVGAYAFFGHGVSLLTGSHDVSKTGRTRMYDVPRAGRDIVVEPGAWLASHVTVIGPCVIGEDAVVAAGAVVLRDVRAGEIVGGVPASHLGWVPGYSRGS